jgi:hypothetical protein
MLSGEGKWLRISVVLALAAVQPERHLPLSNAGEVHGSPGFVVEHLTTC